MFCDECGKEIPGDSEFCGFCGKASPPPPPDVSPPAPAGPPAAAPPPQHRGVTHPAPPMGQTAPPPVQPGQQAGPPGKSPLPWILGGVGAAVVIAVVLVLVFVVFGGGADTSGPEKVVETLFEAIEKQDVDMLLSTMAPSYGSEVKDALGKEYKEFFEDSYFAAFPEGMEITIKKMDTEIDGDKAVVDVVDGTITYTGEDGEKVTEEASDSDMDSTELVKVDGKWYISSDMWKSVGLDPDSLKDMADKEEDEKTTTEDSETTTTEGNVIIPAYPGAKIDEELSSEIQELELGLIGTVYTTDDPVDKVAAWYREKLSGEPDVAEFSFSDAGVDYESFTLGPIDTMMTVLIFEEEGRTILFIGSEQ